MQIGLISQARRSRKAADIPGEKLWTAKSAVRACILARGVRKPACHLLRACISRSTHKRPTTQPCGQDALSADGTTLAKAAGIRPQAHADELTSGLDQIEERPNAADPRPAEVEYVHPLEARVAPCGSEAGRIEEPGVRRVNLP